MTESERQEDYSILCKGTKSRGFPQRWRPAPFSSGRLCGTVKPEKGAPVVHAEELDPSRRGSQPDSYPKSAAKYPDDKGGLDSSHGNWCGRETSLNALSA